MKEQFSETENGLLVRAPAKINLALLIAGKRPDGFHEIKTVMSKIDLYDELLFERGDKDGIELVCKGSYWAPDNRDNLIHRACRMLSQHAGIKPNIRITLTKNIPPGAGLGGGSSDAASSLLALKKFASIKVTDKIIWDLAARLGSDVPFFLDGPLAICTGRGGKIQKIQKKYSFRAALFLPDINSSTQKVYGNYAHDGDLYQALNKKINDFIAKKDIDSLTRLCANMLENSCYQLYSSLADLKTRIETLGIGPVCLSGSGSAMYCMVADTVDLNDRYQETLEKSADCKCVIVHNNRW